MKRTGKLNCGKLGYAIFVLWATTMMALTTQAPGYAQTFTTLHSFDFTDGALPRAGLVQATNGNLYGTTGGGVATSDGTVFKITPGGTLTNLHSFSFIDGAAPVAGLVQATNGSFYGTTNTGGTGPGGGGTVFKITPNGILTTLYNFCTILPNCTDGAFPTAGLIQATDGSLYGTTEAGGTNVLGTVFKITPGGTLTTLHSFCAGACADGQSPTAALIQAVDGNFYGTTQAGGANLGGTVFKITPGGLLTTLYTFCSQSGCADGEAPGAGLIQASDGNFYGTTETGGANLGGTVFKITAGGSLTTLYSFCSQSGCTDGQFPAAALVQANDGNLYGTTSGGGVNGGQGTIFKITLGGTLTTLYNFCSQNECTDGAEPLAALVQDTNGKFYGTAEGGAGYGVVFSLSVGLRPFVETTPTSGKVGTTVRILGSNLTGATNVSFNGTAATFKVVSGSEITTTVPTGATTGKVTLTTPKGTLSGKMSFQVS
jgi:uncharacterized repeat protein (TIGR03803 family)